MHGFYKKKDSRTTSLRLYIPRIVSRVTYRNYTLKTWRIYHKKLNIGYRKIDRFNTSHDKENKAIFDYVKENEKPA